MSENTQQNAPNTENNASSAQDDANASTTEKRKKPSLLVRFLFFIRYTFSFKRHKRLYAFIGALLIIGLILGSIWFTHSRFIVSTEDAYVEGSVVTITTQVAGNVTYIGADNTDFVSANDVLIKLDPMNAKLNLAKSKLALAQTVRNLRNQYAKTAELQAHIMSAKTDLKKAEVEYHRRMNLARANAVSVEELQQSKQRYDNALAAYHAAEAQFAAQQALIDHTEVKTHPNVLSAIAAVKEAYLSLHRTQLRAPVSGMVTKRTAQIGQFVNVGATMMSVVPLDHVWVSANFKESELELIRTGQEVTLIADVYGDSMKYHGKVIGLDAGTGNAFALLPAQNATGNWIKVVQRLPVRIELDPDEIKEKPLRIGLSMKVKIDTREFVDNNEQPTPQMQRYKTDIFEYDFSQLDVEIDKIINDNM